MVDFTTMSEMELKARYKDNMTIIHGNTIKSLPYSDTDIKAKKLAQVENLDILRMMSIITYNKIMKRDNIIVYYTIKYISI